VRVVVGERAAGARAETVAARAAAVASARAEVARATAAATARAEAAMAMDAAAAGVRTEARAMAASATAAAARVMAAAAKMWGHGVMCHAIPIIFLAPFHVMSSFLGRKGTPVPEVSSIKSAPHSVQSPSEVIT